MIVNHIEVCIILMVFLFQVLVLAFSLVFFPVNKNVGSPDKTSAANYAPVNGEKLI